MIHVTQDQTAFYAYYFDDLSYMFSGYGPYTFEECPVIVQVIIGKEPADLQYVYLLCQPSLESTTTFIVALEQPIKGTFVVMESNPLNQYQLLDQSQPFITDLDGDLTNEYLVNSISGGLTLVTFNISAGTLKEDDFYSNYVILPSDDPACLQPNQNDVMSIPHSSSILDFDGDCQPDLFLTKQRQNTSEYYYEIYSHRLVDYRSQYCLVQSEDLPVDSKGNLPLFDFADFNRDAVVDMILYFDDKIQIFYNRYTANLFSDESLCSDPYPIDHLTKNPFFTPAIFASSDSYIYT
mmetsp:Transcript_1471/g.987  ORF Transcript_1471/g.987 Transcript_1471/m.987 type:complete len:294 (-) Transcript_1471:919-1800(-)